MKLWWPVLISGLPLSVTAIWIAMLCTPASARLCASACAFTTTERALYRLYSLPVGYHQWVRRQRINALAVMCRLRFRPGLFLNGVFSIRTTVCWSFLRLSCDARCLSSGCFYELQFITTVRAFRESDPSRTAKERAFLAVVQMPLPLWR